MSETATTEVTDVPERYGWIDASAGIAGDMLLGALLDAGADLERVRAGVEAVVRDSVRIERHQVVRAGMRAAKAEVDLLVDDPPHRTWATVRTMITEAGLPEQAARSALAVFRVLAEAEGRVHGIPAEDVHFHEVGALDSIADVVGVCVALDDLGVRTLGVGEVSLGSGEITAAHGRMPVPVPAVLQLSSGWRVRAGGRGELTTPTGMALVAALCGASEELPALVVDRVGVGAGTKDFPDRANVTRVVIGSRSAASAGRAPTPVAVQARVLEANVDDLDPRLWPGVINTLLAAGADDAWLVPILMKKGRPAHTLRVLTSPDRAAALRELIMAETTTFGVRESSWTKYPLERRWVDVEVDGHRVPIKIAVGDDVIVRATPEFESVATMAAELGRPVVEMLARAEAAADAAGLRAGRPVPVGEQRQSTDRA